MMKRATYLLCGLTSLLLAGTAGCWSDALADPPYEDGDVIGEDQMDRRDFQRPTPSLGSGLPSRGDGAGFGTSTDIERLKLEVWTRGQRQAYGTIVAPGSIAGPVFEVYRNNGRRDTLVAVNAAYASDALIRVTAFPPNLTYQQNPQVVALWVDNTPGAAQVATGDFANALMLFTCTVHYFIVRPSQRLSMSPFNAHRLVDAATGDTLRVTVASVEIPE